MASSRLYMDHDIDQTSESNNEGNIYVENSREHLHHNQLVNHSVEVEIEVNRMKAELRDEK